MSFKRFAKQRHAKKGIVVSKDLHVIVVIQVLRVQLREDSRRICVAMGGNF